MCAVGDSEAHDISRVFLLSIIQGSEYDNVNILHLDSCAITLIPLDLRTKHSLRSSLDTSRRSSLDTSLRRLVGLHCPTSFVISNQN
jgi:hypothetical protein